MFNSIHLKVSVPSNGRNRAEDDRGLLSSNGLLEKCSFFGPGGHLSLIGREGGCDNVLSAPDISGALFFFAMNPK